MKIEFHSLIIDFIVFSLHYDLGTVGTHQRQINIIAHEVKEMYVIRFNNKCC